MPDSIFPLLVLGFGITGASILQIDFFFSFQDKHFFEFFFLLEIDICSIDMKLDRMLIKIILSKDKFGAYTY